jgi:hypothetical protein
MTFKPEEREELLRQQQKLTQTSVLRAWVFARLHGFVDRRLAADVERQFAAPEPRSAPPQELVHIR